MPNSPQLWFGLFIPECLDVRKDRASGLRFASVTGIPPDPVGRSSDHTTGKQFLEVRGHNGPIVQVDKDVTAFDALAKDVWIFRTADQSLGNPHWRRSRNDRSRPLLMAMRVPRETGPSS